MTPTHNSLVVFMKDLLNNLRLDVQHLHSNHSKEIHRDFDTLICRLEHEGLPFVTSALPRLGKAVQQGFQTGKLIIPQGFKRRPGTSLPLILSGLIVDVFDYEGHLRTDAHVGAVKLLMQICFLVYKLELPFTDDQINSKLCTFVKTEQDLRHLNLDARDDVLQYAQALITEVLSDFDHKDIIPHHGPGAVATSEKAEQKWIFKRKYTKLHNVYPYYEYFVPSRASLLRRIKWYKSLKPLDAATSKVTLVPKDSRGPRVISMEPLELQFIQQGIKDKLYTHLERHPLTKGFVNFTDQTINGKLAIKASIDNSLATLDLKEASDRVSLQLVNILFHRTNLLEALLATRSDRTSYQDSQGKNYVLELMKFAPMGSALSFPIEALVFWSLIHGIIASHKGELNVRDKTPVYVYGDDIIVPSEYAHVVMNELPRFGLLVNTDKSFVDGPFRESCGFDAFSGELVTPIKLKKLWPVKNASASLLSAYADHITEFYSRGYGYVARFLRSYKGLRQLKTIPGKYQNGIAIRMPFADLPPVKRRADIQGNVHKILSLIAVKRETRLKGEQRLFANLTGSMVSHYEVPYASHCKLRWCALRESHVDVKVNHLTRRRTFF